MSEDILQVEEKTNIQSKPSKFKKKQNHPHDKNELSRNKRYKLQKKLNL